MRPNRGIKKDSIPLTGDHARAVVLGTQGLLQKPIEPAGKSDVLQVIRRMNALQIDTINVIARSPYLVLWSRLGQYEPRWLDELLAEGQLFEYWSHAACFLPIEDYGLYRRAMLDSTPRSRAWLEEHAEVASRVLRHIHEHGAVRSANFERMDGRTGTWWDWKPEKQALERLYTIGTLMIARRDPNFHRVYDLRERVLPGWDDAATPPPAEVRRTLTLKAVRALGVTRAKWIPDYFRTSRRGLLQLVEELTREGSIVQVDVEGWDEPGFVHRDTLPLLDAVMREEMRPTVTTLLSPFDPLTWDRARMSELFGFQYRIETYTPQAKRRFGYFSLPILHLGALIGRLDAKAHRKQGRFEVRMLHLEAETAVTNRMVTAIAETIYDCARWHGTPEIAVVQSDPPDLAGELRALL